MNPHQALRRPPSSWRAGRAGGSPPPRNAPPHPPTPHVRRPRPSALWLVVPWLASGCALFRARPPVYEAQTLPGGVVAQDLVVPENGEPVGLGDAVTIHYTLRLADGTEVDSTLASGRPVTVVLGEGRVPEGLEQGLLGMLPFGSRQITVPPAAGYGKAGLPPLVPPNATLIFEVEVLHVERGARPLDARARTPTPRRGRPRSLPERKGGRPARAA